VDGEGFDELLLFEGKSLVVYAAGADGFKEQRRSSTEHAFRSVDEALNPRRYVPRPLVTRLDEEGKGRGSDPVDVVLRAENGDLVAFFGHGDGSFDETTLFPAPPCERAACAGQAIAEVHVGDPRTTKLVVVGPGLFGFYKLEGKKPAPIEVDLSLAPPLSSTDYVAVGAADLDGDGVDDLAVMPSGSSIHILRGIPVHE